MCFMYLHPFFYQSYLYQHNIFLCIYIHLSIYIINISSSITRVSYMYIQLPINLIHQHNISLCMGRLRLVGSLKLYVSFAKETHKTDDILQKRPIILRSLLIVATPYLHSSTISTYVIL